MLMNLMLPETGGSTGYGFVTYLYCARRGELRKLAEVAKNREKTHHAGQRSFKVTEFVNNQSATSC